MQTRELQYDLPPELIAQQPCEPRDASRLMVVHRQTGQVEHRIFRDLPAYLRPEDCLVVNRTKVMPAKFAAYRATGGRIAGLFVKEGPVGRWWVMLTGAKRLKAGERLRLGASKWLLRLEERLGRGLYSARVEPPDSAAVVLGKVGAAPLPPYIRRSSDGHDPDHQADLERYQTVYAAAPGAVAAPTAGLHFTDSLLAEIDRVGVSLAELVLHVGLGTFQPVEVDDLTEHLMYKEWFDLPAGSAETLRATRSDGGRIVAVGTTSVRVLETCAGDGHVRAGRGWTDLLIYPPYAFQTTDALLTNFHLPGSTLLALVCAFAGRDRVMEAYGTAVRDRYRFYSYGDAMLIL